MTEAVLFVDDDGRRARVAAALLSSMHGDEYEGRACAIDPSEEIPDLPDLDLDEVSVPSADDVTTDGVPHVVTINSEAKANCPMLSPGTHYLHWTVDARSDDDLKLELADRISRAFGEATTFTSVDELPGAWDEEE